MTRYGTKLEEFLEVIINFQKKVGKGESVSTLKIKILNAFKCEPFYSVFRLSLDNCLIHFI